MADAEEEEEDLRDMERQQAHRRVLQLSLDFFKEPLKLREAKQAEDLHHFKGSQHAEKLAHLSFFFQVVAAAPRIQEEGDPVHGDGGQGIDDEPTMYDRFKFRITYRNLLQGPP